MKRSRFLLNTLKETPKEAVVISHQLMLRAGMIRQVSAGIYSYLPFALRSMRKIEQIVREELHAAGCQELSMPTVQPAGLWEESGRWKAYGKELLRFHDRKDNAYCLGPTHEEVITDIVRHEVRSYKDLPLNLYQIQTKFRDEIRPRFGLMRGREFLMKDAYSFDVDMDACTQSYWEMHAAYTRIFSRCGLAFRPVEADPGAIGGSVTHEFHVLANSGEDLILSCSNCDYAANVERCEVVVPEPSPLTGHAPAVEEVATPHTKTIDQLTKLLDVPASSCLKTLLYKADDRPVGVVIAGHRELNEIALKNLTDADELALITEAETFQNLGLVPGFLGPVGWPESIPLYVDHEVMAMAQGVAGANKKDAHLTGVVPARDIAAQEVLHLRKVVEGDGCPRCNQGVFKAYRGIEVGHVFILGTKYSDSMGATYLDPQGKEQSILMGCYGIGIGRTMAAAIEQNHDEHGIIWPIQVAPFHVLILNLDPKDDGVNQAAEALYQGLQSRGVEVLVDDTALRPGPKFKDADLVGIPLQIIVGARSLQKGVIELKTRQSGEKQSVAVGNAVEDIIKTLQGMGWKPSTVMV